MLLCQWHISIIYGKQGDALKLMKDWLGIASEKSGFKRSRSNRIIVGHVGASASHIIAEHQFESLAEWEVAIKDMADPRFKQLSDQLAPLVVPGSQHWEVYRIVE
jgi:hypothetical protein